MAKNTARIFNDLPFTQTPNVTARDRRLSLEARGALTYLLSHNRNYKFRTSELMKEFSIGRDKLLRITNELKEFGYLKIVAIHKDDGTFGGYDWSVYGLSQSVDYRSTENTDVGENRTSGLSNAIKNNNKKEEQEEKKEEQAHSPEISNNAHKELDTWLSAVRRVYNTNFLPNEQAWMDTCINAINENFQLDAFIKQLRYRLANKGKYNITPAWILKDLIEQRATETPEVPPRELSEAQKRDKEISAGMQSAWAVAK